MQSVLSIPSEIALRNRSHDLIDADGKSTLIQAWYHLDIGTINVFKF